ncbi:chemotaxis protein histidine kinase CheA [Pararhizobium capsulatum DSM 1112]|uniref:Chemotaxis protein histidine kinase CheA n=1 Tax=Pararhizobium capsulatum DSM 1112 TaxID=1121113 RepID=A0ABU0BTZ5_9HYPH|nr:DUF930 domain-containing protein [Pararhizobium capsulatum]MDQ0321159.1 chemotaxis protein histidine kinase CheA [Pararhizobium capsulatum DSM 1112]
MQQQIKRRWKEIGWGTIVSVALHIAVGLVLLFQLPMPDFTPPAEETISVEIVPPPPEKAAEPTPEEKKAEEQPPPPPQEQQAQEQPAAEQPPAEVPIPVLRPVYEFADKDTGAKRADEGNSSEDQPLPQPEKTVEEEAKPPEPEKTAQEEVKPPEPEKTAQEEAKSPEPEKAAEAEKKPEIEALTAMADAVPSEKAYPLPGVVEADSKAPAEAEKPEEIDKEIPEVKKLFSKDVSDDPIARTAMGNLSRSERIARLCSSELYAQLQNGSPAYKAELVPSYDLPKGNILKVQRAAFRARNRWYDLSFRCEVDAEGTRIYSFGFDVGAEVPKSQWRSRGFPSS